MSNINNNIEKLKVIDINNKRIMVENIFNDKGTIFISDVSNFFVPDLSKAFSVGDIIYGKLINNDNNTRCYSLKIGHTSESKYVRETGGGNLILMNFKQKFK